ncbi:uncharacterized protein LOC129744898 [Uranotaenia lowii]|uniref:uncharacterized protein LOC129744898 n=1 Tax=Uranotaenia lowii TaxID=190385 RepID=UPI00247A0CD4|nr:uncharacterized protein LOC129744898 [Uranotaenia lowii]
MDTELPGPSRRCSSRLSLSRNFAKATPKDDSKKTKSLSKPSSAAPSETDSTEIMHLLKENPFHLTQLTLEQEDDLISRAPDAVTLSSKASEPDTKVKCPPSPMSVISVSSNSDHEAVTPRSKMNQYFTPLKSRRNSMSSDYRVSTAKSTARKTSSRQPRATPGTVDSNKVKKARRQICKTTNIKMLTNKYFDESQKRITNFFEKIDEDPDRVGYLRVLKSSTMPAINTGDENMEQFLAVQLTEDAQPIRPSQLQGPSMDCIPDNPERIIQQIEKIQSINHDQTREDWNMEVTDVPMLLPKTPQEEAADSGYSNDGPTTAKPLHTNAVKKTPAPKKKPESSKSTAKKKTTQKTPATKRNEGRKIVCPKYKIIAGTTFAVDAFRYGDIEGVSHYFLTHFHADHYIGLKRSFNKPLVLSPITGRLVKAFINVDEMHYIQVELHETIEIDGVRITALDANHCPGAVMFLFQLPNGTNILHTGDFRASAEMEEYPEWWNMDIHSIYLDTTYLSSKYAFKSQWESITDACAEVRLYLGRNIGARVLIVCGSYLIGKEKVWAELAAQFNGRVWTEPNRRKALEAIGDPLLVHSVVDDQKDANIHVLAMNKLGYDELVAHVEQFPDRYDSVIAIRPSGWEKNSRPQWRGRINIIGIEYSEHSSFDELRRFVRFLRPREVISTVPYGNSNQNRTPQVPVSWYTGEVKPDRKALQLSMTSFVKIGTKTPLKERNGKSYVAPYQDEEDDCTIVEESVGKEEQVEDGKAESPVVSERGELGDSDSDWMP